MGLVQYDSDDDSDEQMQVEAQPEPPAQRQVDTSTKTESDDALIQSQPPIVAEPPAASQPQDPQTEEPNMKAGPQLPSQPKQIGPVLGPTLGPQPPPPPTGPNPEEEEVDIMSFLETDDDPNNPNPNEPPKSPYTIQRTLLRDLTLPAIDISTLEIPPSPPPNSSSQQSQTTLQNINKKFDDFLQIKRSTSTSTKGPGVHFNERLATSPMLKNPSLMDKMLGFVGIESEFLGPDDVKATEQYMTTLPSELWDPSVFPDWAYKGMLRRTQERVGKERERGKGEPVQFVGGGVVGGSGDAVVGGLSAPGSRSGTPGVGSSSTAAGGKRKSRFDA